MKAKFTGAYGVLEVEGTPAEVAELMRSHVRPAELYAPAQPTVSYSVPCVVSDTAHRHRYSEIAPLRCVECQK